MDVRQLNYFMAVAEAQSLSKAAERLHMSQPPLSRHIRALEDQLGVPLFTRVARGMTLTEAGEELLRHSKGILALVDRATVQTRRAGKGQTGRLDIGVHGSSIFGLVARILGAFKRAHPEVELALHNAPTPLQIAALRQGRVALVFERLLPHESDVQVVHLGRDRLLLALSETHALARHDAISVADLAGQSIVVGSSPEAAATALELCRAHGFEPQLATNATDVVTATLLVSTGQGVTFVPESMTNVRFPGVVYRPLKSQKAAHMDLHCFFLRSSTSALVAAMLDVIQEFGVETGSGTSRVGEGFASPAPCPSFNDP